MPKEDQREGIATGTGYTDQVVEREYVKRDGGGMTIYTIANAWSELTASTYFTSLHHQRWSRGGDGVREKRYF